MEVRDRWFHGIHAHSLQLPKNKDTDGPARTPEDASASSSSSSPLPPTRETNVLASPAELVKLDLYGTLEEKHVRLTRAQLRRMYADVRERTSRTFSGLTQAQLRAAPEPDLNPFDWG
jgi:hypothetical protein